MEDLILHSANSLNHRFAPHPTGRISTPSRVVALESLNSSSYPPPHTHLILKTSTAECAWSDSRRFGQVFLTDSEDAWESLAPDALSMSSPEILVAAATTFQQLSSKGKGAKELLLDQKRFVSGIGNWIADEIMYQCEIHPDQNYLTLGEATTLLKAACDICTTAIRCNEEKEGGGDEEMNAFPDDWLFHYRWAKKATGAKDSKGRNISFLTSGGRTSAIVALIQKKQGRKRAAEEAKTDKTKTKAKSAPKSKAKPSTKANAPSKRKR